MRKINPQNERLKREYLIYLKEARGKSEATLDAVTKALCRFEDYNKAKDFKSFRREQAIAFKAHLKEVKALSTGETLTFSTQLATLNNLKEFFLWLRERKEFRAKINYDDIHYFSLSDKETAIAKAPKLVNYPSFEQIQRAVQLMPHVTPIERRNRALIAFTALTCLRDGALASLSLKHFDPIQKLVRQEPDLVKTKFSKPINTFLAPIDDTLETIVINWVKELKEAHYFSSIDPLFPKTKMGQDENYTFTAIGLEKAHWQTASPIRAIFKEAFENAGFQYFHPHSFRHTLSELGQRLCKTPEQFKAWSQNFGHENVMTTLTSYGAMNTSRQGEVIRGLNQAQDDVLERVRELLKVA